LRGDIRERVKSIMAEISRNHEFEIDTMEVVEDHVHISLSFPHRYSIAKVVGVLKSISGSVIFEKYKGVKEYLWRCEFWEDGYFAETVGQIDEEIVRKYIKEQHG